VEFTDLSGKKNVISFVHDLLDRANQILKQCGVHLEFKGLSTTVGDKSQFNRDKKTFVGGQSDGKSVGDVSKGLNHKKNVINVVLVDQITGSGSRMFGLDFGEGIGDLIILGVNYPPSPLNDTPWRTLAHECGNHWGLKDRDRSGRDGANLMSYGRWGENGLTRGTDLDQTQIDQIRKYLLP
jgi:hypothetical protein